MEMCLITLPPKFKFRKILKTNPISQLIFPKTEWDENELAPERSVTINGEKILISARRTKTVPEGFDDVLYAVDGKFIWSNARKIEKPKWNALFSWRDEIASKLKGKLKFIEEIQATAVASPQRGLRRPQIGAIYSVL